MSMIEWRRVDISIGINSWDWPEIRLRASSCFGLSRFDMLSFLLGSCESRCSFMRFKHSDNFLGIRLEDLLFNNTFVSLSVSFITFLVSVQTSDCTLPF
ncbi:unnamed protein product [Moneuplotes crassus]|uniref:Uncharacterized protein n=1 Tax=Euplotes crassus TaxID=5936 RepID=A0AAD1XTY4_EUPCR|nr:unnamed protein product [Moneuplotes crassus]